MAGRSDGQAQHLVCAEHGWREHWGSEVRLSNLGSGAPYKDADGYTFTDGDYFGIAVGSTGVAHVIWGEADGSSLYCCGDVWYTKGS